MENVASTNPNTAELTINTELTGNALMQRLRELNGQLEKRLMCEFGEGGQSFMVLAHPLPARGNEYSAQSNDSNRQNHEDRLIVTPNGNFILRAGAGKYIPLDADYAKREPKIAALYAQKYPEVGEVLERSGVDTLRSEMLYRLLNRKPVDPANSGLTQIEGINYAQGTTSTTFSFGEGYALTFQGGKDQPIAYFDKASQPVIDDVRDINRSGGRNNPYARRELAQGLGRNSREAGMTLLLKPDPEEVKKALEYNLNTVQKIIRMNQEIKATAQQETAQQSKS